MDVKKVDKTRVAVHRFKTSLAKIHEAVGVKPQMVYEELIRQHIEPIAPQIWNYIGSDGKLDTQFTLEICIPVSKIGEDNHLISFRNLNEFKCVTHMLKGPWSELGNTYDKLFQQIKRVEIIPTGNCREVYHHCNFEEQDKCITEIQVEIM